MLLSPCQIPGAAVVRRSLDSSRRKIEIPRGRNMLLCSCHTVMNHLTRYRIGRNERAVSGSCRSQHRRFSSGLDQPAQPAVDLSRCAHDTARVVQQRTVNSEWIYRHCSYNQCTITTKRNMTTWFLYDGRRWKRFQHQFIYVDIYATYVYAWNSWDFYQVDRCCMKIVRMKIKISL